VKIWHPQKGAQGGCVWLIFLLLFALLAIAYLTGKNAG
jgi:hypothetical protein